MTKKQSKKLAELKQSKLMPVVSFHETVSGRLVVLCEINMPSTFKTVEKHYGPRAGLIKKIFN